MLMGNLTKRKWWR